MAKDKRPVKEFEGTPNPWNNQKPKTVEFDPKQGPKGKATVKPEKPEPEKPITEPTETDLEGFLAVLKRLGKPSTSREISDALGIKDADKGRALVRRVMEKLIKDGKVVAVKPEKGRAKQLYKLP